MLTMKKRKSNVPAIAVTIVCFAAFAVFVITMLKNASATSWQEALKAVEDSVIRAAVSCYAYEGFYPDSVDYLVEHYNLNVDTEKYLLYYNKSADNLMPNIIVLDRGKRLLYEIQS